MKNIRLPLWLALIFPVGLLFLVSFSWLVYSRTQEIVGLIDDKGRVVLESSTQAVRHEIRRFMEVPFTLQLSAADTLVRQGLLEGDNLSKAQPYLKGLFEDVYQTNHKEFNMIQIGTEKGEFAGFRTESNGQITHFLKDRRTQNKLIQYKPNSEEVAEVIDPYDPRTRPWYLPVKQSYEHRWSDIYHSSTETPYTAISATSPVLAKSGELLGVLSTDVSLVEMSEFLKKTVLHKNFQSTLLYIVDTKGRLIASTRSDVTLSRQIQRKADLILKAEESSDALTRNSYEWLSNHLYQSSQFSSNHFTVNAPELGNYFGHVMKFDDGRGLTWHVVALVSAGELTGTVRENAVRTLATSLTAVGCLLLLLTGLVIKRFVRPIEETASGAERLAKDAASGIHLNDTGIIRETSSLTRAFNAMSREIQQQVGKLRELAMRDTTTGAYNRIGLLSSVTWEEESLVEILCIGIDNFKVVNSSLGPTVGDQILKEVAQRLMDKFQGEAWVGRLGGDEFLVVRRHLTLEPAHQSAVEQVREVFSKPFKSDTDELELSVCIGVVSKVAPSDQLLPELLQHASVSLRSAKAIGSGSTAFFESKMLEDAKHKAHYLLELKAALHNNEFLVYFQPIVNLNTREVHGMEALIRWRSPTRGLVSPGEFIPAIEESGLIVEVGAWVMRQATSEIAELMRNNSLPAGFTLHVNVSVRQLVQSDFLETVRQAIKDSGLPPGVLMVEVTESLLMENDAPILATMNELREMNVGIALDDFGTGYSSLSYLHRFAFHALKIDRSFVVAAEKGAKTESILRAVIDITKGLKVDAVAEGIETDEQAAMLEDLGAEFAQGYLFSRPGELSDIWKKIQAHKAEQIAVDSCKS